MIKDQIKLILKFIQKKLSNDESIFRFVTGIKIALIPLLTAGVMFAMLLILLKLDLLFFESNGYPEIAELKDTFYSYIFASIINYLPLFALFVVLMAFSGGYIANLLIRPFKMIGDYSEKQLQKKHGGQVEYNPDFFTDLKLLTTFSEFFFYIIDNSKKNNKLSPVTIPLKYTKIHRPVFERGFFLQYSLFLLIISICVGILLYVVTVGIHENIVQLAIKTLPSGAKVGRFLQEQSIVLDGILVSVMVAFELFYIFLSINLYSKVSGPAFGFFATMRAFLKGSYSSRVHLLGNYHIREHSRKFNLYLSYLEKNYVEVKKKTDTIK